jgi:hypothetical protein
MLKQYHLDRQEIPEGHRIYDERLEVRGIELRRADAIAFCKAKGQWLELDPEPTNRHDPNAIKLTGCWRGFFGTKRRHLGYVPREVASRLGGTGLIAEVKPRLLKTYVGNDEFVEVEFQITGPVERFRDYRPLTDAPMDRVTKLKEDGKLEEAIDTLTAAVEAEELEAKRKGHGVAPWPYRELAVLYRKLKRYEDEVAILERYEAQEKAPGRSPAELAERLTKARARLDGKRRRP